MPLFNLVSKLQFTNSAGAETFAITDKRTIKKKTIKRKILKEQLTEININKSNNTGAKPIFRLSNWSKFSGTK